MFLESGRRRLSMPRVRRSRKRVRPRIAERIGDDCSTDHVLLHPASQHQIAPRDDAIRREQFAAAQTALCREHGGDRSGAMEQDRAAIYLDASFAMPHLHLGLLAKRSGDLPAARTLFRRVSAEDPAFVDVAERLAALS